MKNWLRSLAYDGSHTSSTGHKNQWADTSIIGCLSTIAKFENAKIFDGKSFWDAESEIE
jgi:hypothetical protein